MYNLRSYSQRVGEVETRLPFCVLVEHCMLTDVGCISVRTCFVWHLNPLNAFPLYLHPQLSLRVFFFFVLSKTNPLAIDNTLQEWATDETGWR